MSIRIEVSDKWVITSDQYQFILNEKKVVKSGKKAGEEWLDTIGYYPKINQLISGLIHHHIQTATINSLVEMAAEIERVGNLCTAAVMPKDETTVIVRNAGGVPWIADVDHGQFYPDEFPVDRMSPGEVTHWMRFPE